MSDPDDGANGGGMDDEELAETADELSDVLRDLRDELRASREARGAEPVEQPSGSGGGVPEIDIDLPSASDVLAFTDEKLIPAAITVLEVNIKALELLQKGIRWARPDRAGENARAVQSHAESVSRSTLKRLDTVLADLQEAASEGSLPENAEASGIITEARRLRDEIDTALEERAEARGETDDPEILPPEDSADGDDEDDTPPSPWGEQPEVDVDVEGELESIKAELGKADEDEVTADEDEVTADGEGDATVGDGDTTGEEREATDEDEDVPDEEDASDDGDGTAGTDDDPDHGSSGGSDEHGASVEADDGGSGESAEPDADGDGSRDGTGTSGEVGADDAGPGRDGDEGRDDDG